MKTSLFWVLVLSLGVGSLGCGDDDGATDAMVPEDAPMSDAPGDDAPAPDDAGPEDDAPPLADAGDDAGMDAGFDGGPMDCSEMTAPTLAYEMIGRFNTPVFITAAPDDPDRLYVVEKGGTIRVVEDGTTLDDPFLTVGGLLTDGEQGLLGLAFHPDYETNGRFFIFSTPGDPRRNVVDEYVRSDGNPLVANETRVRRLVSIDDPRSNHNGGALVFGPDGFLYAGLGDSGGGGDPDDNGLDTGTLLGSILRLDVDNEAGDFAAEGNPFIGMDGEDQIWAYGIRNAWRMSFDRLTGDLYIGDVGQGRWEEVDVLEPDDGGANLGWSAYEGTSVFDESKLDRVDVHHEPIHEYRHGDFDGESVRGGVSITGGYVYRGSAIPELNGFYLFADYGSTDIAALRYCEGAATSVQRLNIEENSIASFGEDGNGELYVVSIGGRIRRIIAAE